MRSGPVIPLPFLLMALAMLADSARAGEMFVCPDKTVLYVDADTRATLSEHPCVKAHFAKAKTPSAPAKFSAPTPVAIIASEAGDGTIVEAPAEPARGLATQVEATAAGTDSTGTKTEIKRVRFGKRS